ncbi:hypothetical protein Q5Y75_09465 [Ruegeria sp. 2205SS24-7]|uniref:hypothetical protein n=1 Tax=Ruegeria discodermiae TaxID=3064389 RepID=UPI0027423AF6|nr:hypothetical protein [Ruegeria sp. 2205SS24-7]MDP5217443.1 hypothetical protein [Ruegeria sp. 2205SS24-7]
MKAIVHVGSPKAGSTSIQVFLERNSSALAQQGIRYQRHTKRFSAQVEFGVAACSAAGRMITQGPMRGKLGIHDLESQKAFSDDFLKQFKRQRKRWKEDEFVLSAEQFQVWLNTPELIAVFDDLLGKHFDEVRYVLYLRAPEELALSGYSERLKQGMIKTFDEFLDTRPLKRANQNVAVRRWEDVVGPDRLDVRLLDRDFLVEGDLIADFCHVLGISPEGLKQPPRVNQSLSAEAAAFLLRFNRLIPELGSDGRTNPLRGAVADEITKMSDQGRPLRMTPQQFERIRAETAKGCEALRARRFPQQVQLYSSDVERLVETNPPPEASDLDAAITLAVKLYAMTRMGDLQALSGSRRTRAILHEDGSPPAPASTGMEKK